MKALILAGLAVPALVTTAHGGFQVHMHEHLHEMVVKKLALTQDQQDAAMRVMMAHHPSLHAKGQAVFQTRADLLQALTDPQTTEGQIQAMEAQASTAHLALELELNQVVREVAPILTPDQRVKARQMVLDARAHVETFLAGLAKEAPAGHGI